MGEYIAIVGLPGSGKSTHSKKREKALDAFRCCDYFAKHEDNKNAIQAAIEGGKSVVVNDIDFCRPGKRRELEKECPCKGKWKWEFFECNPKIAFRNCIGRMIENNKVSAKTIYHDVGKIMALSAHYSPCQSPIPIFDAYSGRIDKLIGTIDNEVLRRLTVNALRLLDDLLENGALGPHQHVSTQTPGGSE